MFGSMKFFRPTRARLRWSTLSADNYWDRGTNLGYRSEPHISPDVFRRTQQTAGPPIHFSFTPPHEDERHGALQRGLREVRPAELVHLKNRVSDLTVRAQQTTDPEVAYELVTTLQRSHLAATEEFSLAVLNVFFRANSPHTMEVWGRLHTCGAKPTIAIVDLLLDILLDTTRLDVPPEVLSGYKIEYDNAQKMIVMDREALEGEALSDEEKLELERRVQLNQALVREFGGNGASGLSSAAVQKRYREQNLAQLRRMMDLEVQRKLRECIEDAASREDPSNPHHRIERNLIETQGIGGILAAQDPVKEGLQVFARVRRRWVLGMESYMLAVALAPVPKPPAVGTMDYDPPRRTQPSLLIMLEAVRLCREWQTTSSNVDVSGVVLQYFGRLHASLEDSLQRLDELSYWSRRRALSERCGEPAPSLGHGGAQRNAMLQQLCEERTADAELKTSLQFSEPVAPLYYCELILDDLEVLRSKIGYQPPLQAVLMGLKAAGVRNDAKGAEAAASLLLHYFRCGKGVVEPAASVSFDPKRAVYDLPPSAAEDALAAFTFSGASLKRRQYEGAGAMADEDDDDAARFAPQAERLWRMCSMASEASRGAPAPGHVPPVSPTLLTIWLASVGRKEGPVGVVREFAKAMEKKMPADAAVYAEVLEAFKAIEESTDADDEGAAKSKDAAKLPISFDEVLESARTDGHHYLWAKYV